MKQNTVTQNNKLIADIIQYGKANLIHKFSESDFDQYVITGPQAFQSNPAYQLGRLVQVRIKAGAFGSDLVLLRHHDNALTSHANQWFFRVAPMHKYRLDVLFKDTFPDDPDRDSYSIEEQDPRYGFIVQPDDPAIGTP